MEDARREILKRLLEQALALAPNERATFLDQACRDHPDLCDELTSLLDHADPASAFFHSLAGAVLPQAQAEKQPRAAAENDPLHLVGQTVSHYQILETLGGGGMGVVYKARDTKLDRTVALKFLPPYLSTDEEAKRRFIHEAKAASSLDHPNIGYIHEIGEADDGRLFIAMAYYAGETLKAKIARGALPVEEALGYAIQMAEGLGRAHEAGIVHRDVKPANVMVTERGRVKVMDFGIAKVSDLNLTPPGSTVGTVAYMSPEQARGEQVDHRTDLWSLGVVLYEMLTGERPFKGDYDPAIIYSVLNEEPATVEVLRPEVSGGVAQVVATLLQKDPEARYQTAEEASPALRTFVAPMLPDLPARGQARNRLRRIAVPAGIGLVALIAALALFNWMGEQNDAPVSGGENFTVAVLPFHVHGDTALDDWREGMPTMVSLNLDALTGLMSVDYNAVIGHVMRSQEFVDPELGQAVARHFEADYFILGTLLSVGGSTRMDAALYAASGEREITKQVEQVEMTSIEGLQAAVDELTLGLVIDKFKTPVLDVLRSGFSGVPLAAVKHYLDGEAAMRRWAVTEASSSFKQAIAVDSSFALAWYRLSESIGWDPHSLEEQRQVVPFGERAVELSGSLPPATADLIKAHLLAKKGYFHEAESALRRLIAAQPNHVVAWNMLGDVIYHLGPFHGIPWEQARGPLEKAVSYDPGTREPVAHLFSLARLEGRHADYISLSASYGELESPTAVAAEAIQNPSWMADSTMVRRVREALLQSGGWELHFQRYPAFIEQLASVSPTSFGAEWLLANADFNRGRFAGHIQRLDEEGLSRWWEQFYFLNALAFLPLPEDDQRRLANAIATWRADMLLPSDDFEAEREDIALFVRGLASWRLGDAANARDLAETLHDHAGPENQIALILGYTLEAFLSMDDAETALELLEKANVRLAIPWYGLAYYQNLLGRFLRAELLRGQGNYEDGLRWYKTYEVTGWVQRNLPGLVMYRKAQCLDALGRSAEAVEMYSEFIELWKEADPALRVWVEDARQRVDRLLEESVR